MNSGASKVLLHFFALHFLLRFFWFLYSLTLLLFSCEKIHKIKCIKNNAYKIEMEKYTQNDEKGKKRDFGLVFEVLRKIDCFGLLFVRFEV